MKTRNTGRKRLALDTETVRTLQGQELDAVVGGVGQAAPSGDGGCPTIGIGCPGKQ